VINKKIKNIDNLFIIKNKLTNKKIININISKNINKIIKWNQDILKKILKKIIWIHKIKYKLIVTSIENIK